MRSVCRIVAVLASLAAWLPVAHAESPVPLVRLEEPAQAADPSPRWPVLGATAGVGVPEGASLRIQVRPWRALRLQGGAAYNLVSPGVLGGIEIVPFATAVSPVLSLEAGHFFEGDASSAANAIAHVDLSNIPSARKVSYDFATAELGLDIGSPRFVLFNVRAGLSVVQGQVREFAATLQSSVSSVTIAADDPKVRAVIPAVRLGMTFFLGG